MLEVDFDEVATPMSEVLSEGFSPKDSFKVVKGRSGTRYLVVTNPVLDTLTNEYWYNLDPVNGKLGDSSPQLMYAVKSTPDGRFFIYKLEMFGAAEHPKEKADAWYKRFSSRDRAWLNRLIDDWLATPAGKDFVKKNRLEDCACIASWSNYYNNRMGR